MHANNCAYYVQEWAWNWREGRRRLSLGTGYRSPEFLPLYISSRMECAPSGTKIISRSRMTQNWYFHPKLSAVDRVTVYWHFEAFSSSYVGTGCLFCCTFQLQVGPIQAFRQQPEYTLTAIEVFVFVHHFAHKTTVAVTRPYYGRLRMTDVPYLSLSNHCDSHIGERLESDEVISDASIVHTN